MKLKMISAQLPIFGVLEVFYSYLLWPFREEGNYAQVSLLISYKWISGGGKRVSQDFLFNFYCFLNYIFIKKYILLSNTLEDVGKLAL